MPVPSMRILIIGQPSPHTVAMLGRLAQKGHGYHAANGLAETRELMATFHFDIVLALEKLPDGRAYDLTDSVVQHSATLLVAVALSETCLWLPVVEQGIRVLGERALNTSTLEWDLEERLTSLDREHAIAVKRHKAAGEIERRVANQTTPVKTQELYVALAGPDATSSPSAGATRTK